MAVTGAILGSVLDSIRARGKQIMTLDELAAGLNGSLLKAPAGLTPEGCAAFAATQAQESAYFRTTKEYGDLSKADYFPYVGATFEQVTWKRNYSSMGAWLKSRGVITGDPEQFANDPAWLTDKRWAWWGGVWYFDAMGIWDEANRGEFKKVSQAVNGGLGRMGTSFTPNGWEERETMYNAFLRFRGELMPGGAANDGSTLPRMQIGERDSGPNGPIWRLQDWSNWYAWGPAVDVLTEDGIYGPQMSKAVAQMQARLGVAAPDINGDFVGPKTNSGLARLGYPAKG